MPLLLWKEYVRIHAKQKLLMLKMFLLILPFWLLSICCFGQEGDKSGAVLVDEFGRIVFSEAKARMDNAFARLHDAGANSRLFIVTYRTRNEPVGSKIAFSRWMKGYLVRTRRLDQNRVEIIDGGESNCSVYRIWVAPEGVNPKIERSYRTVFEDADLPRKFDEYYLGFADEVDEPIGDSLDAFAIAVNKEKGATAYVIVYPQYEGRYNNQTDAPSVAAKMSRKIRSDLVSKHKLAASKIQIVNGGYRRLREVELWILPGGEHPPVATPNAFPKINRKTRKTR